MRSFSWMIALSLVASCGIEPRTPSSARGIVGGADASIASESAIAHYRLCSGGNGIEQGSCDPGYVCAVEEICLPKTTSGMSGCPTLRDGLKQTVFGNVCMLLCERADECPAPFTCRVINRDENPGIPLSGYCVGRWPLK